MESLLPWLQRNIARLTCSIALLIGGWRPCYVLYRPDTKALAIASLLNNRYLVRRIRPVVW